MSIEHEKVKLENKNQIRKALKKRDWNQGKY